MLNIILINLIGIIGYNWILNKRFHMRFNDINEVRFFTNLLRSIAIIIHWMNDETAPIVRQEGKSIVLCIKERGWFSHPKPPHYDAPAFPVMCCTESRTLLVSLINK